MRKLRIFALILALPIYITAFGQARLELAPDSRVVIEGSSTINRFACRTDDLSGHGVLSDDGAEAHLTVPVSRLECGKQRMNRDLQDAMKAERHPEIHFELVEAESAGTNGRAEIVGRLTIAGVTRRIVLLPRAEQTGPDTYRIRGEQKLLMSDFGIDPPTALAGLIRTHDEILVRFDVRATKKAGAQAYSLGNRAQ